MKVDELIYELDPNHSGQITHEEFVLIMKYIEQKQAQLEALLKKAQDDEAAAHSELEATVKKMQELQDKLTDALSTAAKELERLYRS